MITVDISDWAAMAAILGVGLTLGTILVKKFDKLDTKIDRTREELRADLSDIRSGIREIEHRTYDLRGQPPAG
ncbi:hypothetical protein [Aeromicrobium sp. CTD01-1L150]|uniref:hypothetical protein n=1 Tax=Aeromicrobium sp. CTD01-1L150 TaxID=3341830 RepID=UPI0035C258AE